MMNTNLDQYESDFFDIVVLFDESKEIPIQADFDCRNGELFSRISVNDKQYEYSKSNTYGLEESKFIKRFAKVAIYRALAEYYHKSMPWGALTGVHPSSLAYEYYGYFHNYNTVRRELIKDFCLDEDKSALVVEIIKNQSVVIKNNKDVDLYVHIPFCDGRCTYCTFFSNDINKSLSLVEPYLDALIVELEGVKEIISQGYYVVRSIYVGGGTPTSLTAEQLDKLLTCLNFSVNEFTVECGRADSITDDKLRVLKKHGVTRISINPQTFCDKTLKTIGRRHNVEQVVEAYKIALKYGFDINMDLIAGLPNETLKNFKKSINTTLEFAPANITVHTLALKRGNLIDKDTLNVDEVGKMVQYALDTLTTNGYAPYYLYRQKKITGGHENVGYTLEGKQCVYNIHTIEETTSILAVGSGAITKKVGSNGHIDRQANSKDLIDYIYRVDEYLKKKRELFI